MMSERPSCWVVAAGGLFFVLWWGRVIDKRCFEQLFRPVGSFLPVGCNSLQRDILCVLLASECNPQCGFGARCILCKSMIVVSSSRRILLAFAQLPILLTTSTIVSPWFGAPFSSEHSTTLHACSCSSSMRTNHILLCLWWWIRIIPIVYFWILILHTAVAWIR